MKFVISLWLAIAAMTHAAGLEFETLVKDVNAPADALTVMADFNFTNTGDQPVSIAKTDSGCTCLSVQISGGKLKYGPGESGVIRATFTMDNSIGTVEKMIALWVEGDPPDKPSQVLTVRIHLPVLVALEPKKVDWVLNGQPEPKTIQIRMAEGELIRVLGVKSSSSGFSFELKTIEEGRKYDLVVTPLTIHTPNIAVIRIETDCKIARHKVLQAFAVVAKPTVTPVTPKS